MIAYLLVGISASNILLSLYGIFLLLKKLLWWDSILIQVLCITLQISLSIWILGSGNFDYDQGLQVGLKITSHFVMAMTIHQNLKILFVFRFLATRITKRLIARLKLAVLAFVIYDLLLYALHLWADSSSPALRIINTVNPVILGITSMMHDNIQNIWIMRRMYQQFNDKNREMQKLKYHYRKLCVVFSGIVVLDW
jgi:hypothetical protein